MWAVVTYGKLDGWLFLVSLGFCLPSVKFNTLGTIQPSRHNGYNEPSGVWMWNNHAELTVNHSNSTSIVHGEPYGKPWAVGANVSATIIDGDDGSSLVQFAVDGRQLHPVPMGIVVPPAGLLGCAMACANSTALLLATKTDDEVAALRAEMADMKRQMSSLAERLERTLQLTASAGPLPELSVADFGAKADGSDDTAAFQKALDSAKAGGNAIVNVPAGTYAIRGHLTVPPNCELRGVNHFPYRDWGRNGSLPHGTTLEAYEGAHNESATPFIFLQGSNVGLSGMSIVYPEQVDPTQAEPIEFPWTVRGAGDDVTVQNVFLVNSYLGIDLGTLPAGRHLIDNVYGNPLKTGIFVDKCYDVGRIRHIHFWNFWAGTGPQVVGELQRWISANGATIILARTDWEVVDDVFSWGYAIGLKLVTSNATDPKTNLSIGASNGQCKRMVS